MTDAPALRGLPDGAWGTPSRPRVSPAERRTLSRTARLVLRLIRRRTKAPYDYNVFRTLARLGSIFPAHSLFLSQILLKGRLSQTEKELVILRVAWRRGCAYEWAHHVHLAAALAVPDERIDTMAAERPAVDDPRISSLITATDELLETGTLTDEAWLRLGSHCSPDEAMELSMLVGHYVMVAMTLNATGVQLEDQLARELQDRSLRHRKQ